MNQRWPPFQFNGDQFGGLPTVSKLKSSGLPTELPTISIEVDSLICIAKFPRAAHGQPTPLPNELHIFSYLEVVDCPLSYPLFPYMEVVGSLICMENSQGQLTPFFCPLSCPLFSYMEVVGSLICMTKFLSAAHSVAHVQPMSSDMGSSPVFFCMGSFWWDTLVSIIGYWSYSACHTKGLKYRCMKKKLF